MGLVHGVWDMGHGVWGMGHGVQADGTWRAGTWRAWNMESDIQIISNWLQTTGIGERHKNVIFEHFSWEWPIGLLVQHSPVADPGGGGPDPPLLGHDVGFLTLGPKLDPPLFCL